MMKIKKFSVALFIGLVLATPFVLKGREDQSSSKLNILFISVDDLNAWVGHIGKNPQAKTPHIDRLADMGVSFLRTYSNGTACNPSRTSLMTGKMPGSTGVYSNKQVWTRLVKEGEGLNHYLLPVRKQGNNLSNHVCEDTEPRI